MGQAGVVLSLRTSAPGGALQLVGLLIVALQLVDLLIVALQLVELLVVQFSMH